MRSALGRRHAPPRAILERAARGAHGAIDVGLVARGDLGQRLFGGWIVGSERVARCCVDPLAVDQHLPRATLDELRHIIVDAGMTAGFHIRMRHGTHLPRRVSRRAFPSETLLRPFAAARQLGVRSTTDEHRWVRNERVRHAVATTNF